MTKERGDKKKAKKIETKLERMRVESDEFDLSERERLRAPSGKILLFEMFKIRSDLFVSSAIEIIIAPSVPNSLTFCLGFVFVLFFEKKEEEEKKHTHSQLTSSFRSDELNESADVIDDNPTRPLQVPLKQSEKIEFIFNF